MFFSLMAEREGAREREGKIPRSVALRVTRGSDVELVMMAFG